MKWVVGVLLALMVAGVVVLAARPGVDAICVVQAAHDRLPHKHPGWQCLHYAASRGDATAIDAILDAGTHTG